MGSFWPPISRTLFRFPEVPGNVWERVGMWERVIHGGYLELIDPADAITGSSPAATCSRSLAVNG